VLIIIGYIPNEVLFDFIRLEINRNYFSFLRKAPSSISLLLQLLDQWNVVLHRLVKNHVKVSSAVSVKLRNCRAGLARFKSSHLEFFLLSFIYFYFLLDRNSSFSPILLSSYNVFYEYFRCFDLKFYLVQGLVFITGLLYIFDDSAADLNFYCVRAVHIYTFLCVLSQAQTYRKFSVIETHELLSLLFHHSFNGDVCLLATI
jgi:hypothetical protein